MYSYSLLSLYSLRKSSCCCCLLDSLHGLHDRFPSFQRFLGSLLLLQLHQSGTDSLEILNESRLKTLCFLHGDITWVVAKAFSVGFRCNHANAVLLNGVKSKAVGCDGPSSVLYSCGLLWSPLDDGLCCSLDHG
jgi:hypothetical protein